VLSNCLDPLPSTKSSIAQSIPNPIRNLFPMEDGVLEERRETVPDLHLVLILCCAHTHCMAQRIFHAAGSKLFP